MELKREKKHQVKIFFTLLLFVLSINLNAQPVLDTNFGNNGLSITSFGSNNEDTPHFLLKQNDQKILTAGLSNDGNTYSIALSRHLPNGQLDTGFGDNGTVFIHFASRDVVNAIAVQQNDNKIVLVGYQAQSNAGSGIVPSVYRFNPDGSVDTSFGTSGFVALRYDGVSSGQFYGISLLSDGKILAAGSKTGNANGGSFGFGAMRFLPDGSLDSTFGIFGKDTINANVLFNDIGCSFTSDGKITMASETLDNGNMYYILARMDSLGNVDSTFGVNGIIQTNIEARTSEKTIPVVTNEGKILLAGTTPINPPTNPNGQFSVFRFLSDGLIDTTFGVSGRTNIDFNLSFTAECYDISLTNDEKIILVGRIFNTGKGGIVRLTKDGLPDTSFAPNGKFVSDLSPSLNYLTNVIALQDGSIISAGTIFGVSSMDFSLVKYNTSLTAIDDQQNIQPSSFSLRQNYPNPFNPSTIIQYQVSSNSQVSLKVYDVLGNEVATLVNEEKPAGSYEVEFKSSVGNVQLASGIYFYKLQAGSFVETKKMQLLK